MNEPSADLAVLCRLRNHTHHPQAEPEVDKKVLKGVNKKLKGLKELAMDIDSNEYVGVLFVSLAWIRALPDALPLCSHSSILLRNSRMVFSRGACHVGLKGFACWTSSGGHACV